MTRLAWSLGTPARDIQAARRSSQVVKLPLRYVRQVGLKLFIERPLRLAEPLDVAVAPRMLPVANDQASFGVARTRSRLQSQDQQLTGGGAVVSCVII